MTNEEIIKVLEPVLLGQACATMSEGFIKSVLVEHLLSSGCSVIEGGADGLKLVRLLKGRLEVLPFVSTEGVDKPRIYADIRVALPKPFVFELQCRSIIGSQNSLFTKNIVDDVWRVEQGYADLFLLVLDGPIYQKMLGNRDGRGRKPLHGDFLPTFLSSSSVHSLYTSFGVSRHIICYRRVGDTDLRYTGEDTCGFSGSN
jgi:hypothetical protein